MAKDQKEKKRIKKKLLDKYRLVILNEDTFEERLTIKLTRLNVIVIISLAGIFLVIGTTLLIAYTPLREYIPGYSSTALKKQATDLSFKTDSLQQIIQMNDRYYTSIKKVLQGDVKTVNFNRDSIIEAAKLDVSEADLNPIKEDSILREKVDKEDFRTWDLQTLFDEISLHYQNSLQQRLMLQLEDLKNYDELLIQQENSKKYRPAKPEKQKQTRKSGFRICLLISIIVFAPSLRVDNARIMVLLKVKYGPTMIIIDS